MTGPFRLGLTGSIGMGKSTTAGFFAEFGIAVWDADATVHRLYAPGAAAALALASHLPQAMAADGSVSRQALKSLIAHDPQTLPLLERLVHPIVAADRAAFITSAASDIVVLDIPLLFETGAQADCDATLVVTAPPALQRSRLRARGTMSETEIDTFLNRQMPDAEKRARATHVVETLSPGSVRSYVEALIAYIRSNRGA